MFLRIIQSALTFKLVQMGNLDSQEMTEPKENREDLENQEHREKLENQVKTVREELVTTAPHLDWQRGIEKNKKCKFFK